MLAKRYEQAISDFYRYPSVGVDDYRYQYETALVRMFELQMLSRSALLDMANASDFSQSAELLASSEYALPPGRRDPEELERILEHRRTALRDLFADLMIDKPIVHLFKTRDDFANLRLALRRSMINKPIGTDYSQDGNAPPKVLEQAFTEQTYEQLPDYMQQAAEQAILAYYQDKDIRRIDHAIDDFQAQYNLTKARRLDSVFLLGLFKIQIDLTNIRTMLRLKFTTSQSQYYDERLFLKGGFLGLDRLKHGLELGYEALGTLFYVTPYYEVVDSGAGYLSSEKSFLRLEQRCDEYLLGFLRTTLQIATGPQPIIAYFLAKEHEIRTMRLILTAKKNHLDAQFILDRIPQNVN
jgi:V/A-type H+-transporting ATPase subunit C